MLFVATITKEELVDLETNEIQVLWKMIEIFNVKGININFCNLQASLQGWKPKVVGGQSPTIIHSVRKFYLM